VNVKSPKGNNNLFVKTIKLSTQTTTEKQDKQLMGYTDVQVASPIS
jgi:hypothetical protein